MKRIGFIALLSIPPLAAGCSKDGEQSLPTLQGQDASLQDSAAIGDDGANATRYGDAAAGDAATIEAADAYANDAYANDAYANDAYANDTDGSPARTGQTPSGVPLPVGWTLKVWDKFGTGEGSTVSTFAQLHAKYYEGQWYNRGSDGLVKIPNVVINGEQETYVHFETAVAWSTDHLTIQARGQPDGSIDSGEIVSKYTARSFCTEARYRIPKSKGSWPAFWFYASTAGGDKSEIDVEQPITATQGVSSVSLYNHPSQSNVVIDDAAFTTNYMTWTNPTFDGSAAPHAYTACYDDRTASLSRYIDGGRIYTATFKWNASLGDGGAGPDPCVTVNFAVGGSWPGDVSNPSAFRDDLDVYSIAYYGP